MRGRVRGSHVRSSDRSSAPSCHGGLLNTVSLSEDNVSLLTSDPRIQSHAEFREPLRTSLCGSPPFSYLRPTPEPTRGRDEELCPSVVRHMGSPRARLYCPHPKIHPAGSRSSCCLLGSRFLDRHSSSASLLR